MYFIKAKFQVAPKKLSDRRVASVYLTFFGNVKRLTALYGQPFATLVYLSNTSFFNRDKILILKTGPLLLSKSQNFEFILKIVLYFPFNDLGGIKLSLKCA